MKQTNAELLAKFDQMRKWMVEDTQRAIFQARANFLVAQGLFNYTEIIGSFLEPDECNMTKRFDAFFKRMGPEYTLLVKRFTYKRKRQKVNGYIKHSVYDDLRCGLTHEHTIKRKLFTVYGFGYEVPLSDEQINELQYEVNGMMIKPTAGVTHIWLKRRLGLWCIFTPKYWLDFRAALDKYRGELDDLKNKNLRTQFFKRARNINFLRFS